MNKRTYYKNGQLKFDCNYDNNKLQGLSKEYYESGQLKAANNYKDGKWEGLCKEYYEDGQLRLEYNYKNDEFDGTCKDYYESGQLKLENNYKEGKHEGVSKRYYENGEIEDIYNCKEGKLDGLCKGYYENGYLRYEHIYKNGKFNGLCKYYYENGKLMEEQNYKNGKLNGLCSVFYKNGQLKAENNYKDGEICFGKDFEYFFENNQKITKINYYIYDKKGNKIIYQEDYLKDNLELIRKNYLVLNDEKICLSKKLIKNTEEIETINDNIKLLVNGKYINLDKNYYNIVCSYKDIIGKIKIRNKDFFFEREFIKEGNLHGLKVLYKNTENIKEYINIELYENNNKIKDNLENRKRLIEKYFISNEEKQNWINIPLKKKIVGTSSIKGIVIFIILLIILYFIYSFLNR
jgi:MORN variant repeat protein